MRRPFSWRSSSRPRPRGMAASPRRLSHRHPSATLSLEQGLSQAAVRALFQDSRGFLWVATEDGLNRYDGYGFTVFRNDPLDPDSLSGQRAAVVRRGPGRRPLDRHGRPRHRTARPLDPAVREVPPRSAAPGRASRPDRSRRFSRTAPERSGRASAAGACCASLRAPPPSRRSGPSRESPGAFPRPSSSPSRKTRTGALWVGTVGQGLLKVDARDGRVLDTFNRDPAGPFRVPRTRSSQTSSSTGRAGSGPPPGRSRASTRRRDEVKVFRNDPSDPASFPSRQARRLAEDASGRIWIATENGLVRLDPETGVFTAFRNRPDDVVEPPIEPDDHRPRRSLRSPLGGPRRIRPRGARPRGVSLPDLPPRARAPRTA